MATKALGSSDFQVGETVEFDNLSGFYRVLITELRQDRIIGRFTTHREFSMEKGIDGGFFYSEIKPGTLKRLSPRPSSVPEVTIQIPAPTTRTPLANGWYLVSNPTSPSGEDMIIRVIDGNMGILFGDGMASGIHHDNTLNESNVVKCRLNFVSQ